MSLPLFFRSPPARYSLAVVVMLAAVGLRWALIPILGLNIPYVTVYPAMMFAAITLGAGPGVLATVLGVLLAEYYFVMPVGIEWDLALTIRGGIPLLTSLYVGRVSQRLRDARARADAQAAAARTAEAALRQQVELIDPARAEVIIQEMQRVLRARQTGEAPPPATPGVWLQRVPDVVGFLVAAVGLLVLAGWVFGVTAFKSVVLGLAAMKVNTALCFVLAGAALVWRERRALRRVCALVVGVVAALSLAEYLSGASFGIDELFIRDSGDLQTVPGRMAQATGISFIFSSLCLLLVGARGRAALWTQQAAALAAGTFGLAALLGYAYEVRQFYGPAGSSSMALHTTVAFTLLAAGLLCARPDGVVSVLTMAGPGGQLARRLLSAAILVPVIVGWLRVQGSKAGLFEPNLGTGLYAIIMILTFAALIWLTARTLDRQDAARRQVEMQLRNQAELMDHAQEVLIVRELGGAIRFWNRGAEALYGWPAAEAIGQRADVLLRADRRLIEEKEAQLERTGHWEGELYHTARDGRRVIVESRETATRTTDGRLLVLESNRDITERKLAEEKVRQFNAELEQRVAQQTAALQATSLYARSLLEASLDPLVTISAEGKITDVNAATEAVTGCDRAALIGTDFSDYFTDPAKARASYQEVFREGFVRDYPLEVRHRDGHITSVLYNASVYRDEAGHVIGVFAAARDITERKRAEQALRESEQRYRTLFETMDEGFCVVEMLFDADGKPQDYRFLEVNPAFEKHTGLEQALGKTIRELVPEHDAHWFEVYGQVATTGQAVRFEERASAMSRWFDVYAFRLGGPASRRVAILFNDITQRKRAEEEIRGYTEDLRRSNQELEHFAYVASHDLQEPLRTISSFSQLLARRYQGRLDTDADEFITFIVEGATRMQTLINDLLAFSRVGTRGNPFAAVECEALLQAAQANLEAAIAESEAVITHDPLPTLVADRTQLTQLFQNLFGNAIKFRRPGQAPRIHVSAARQDGAWQLSVRDNGIGIDSQYFDRIFILFQRLHGREEYPGTGIGLAVCKKIVERHGGRMWVESAPGTGSTFHFTLPDDKTAYDQTRTTSPRH